MILNAGSATGSLPTRVYWWSRPHDRRRLIAMGRHTSDEDYSAKVRAVLILGNPQITPQSVDVSKTLYNLKLGIFHCRAARSPVIEP